jgi:hypothetical protein
MTDCVYENTKKIGGHGYINIQRHCHYLDDVCLSLHKRPISIHRRRHKQTKGNT